MLLQAGFRLIAACLVATCCSAQSEQKPTVVTMSAMRFFNDLSSIYKSLNSRSDMNERGRDLSIGNQPTGIVQDQPDEEVATNLSLAPNRIGLDRSMLADADTTQGVSIFGWLGKLSNLSPGQQAQSYMVHDLRETHCFFPPADQGPCESCASFVAIAQLEYLRCRETGKLEKFSEQFVVDCGGAFGMMGCDGTDVHSLHKFITKVGLMSGIEYPYVGIQRRCPYYNSYKRKYNFEGAKTLKLKKGGIVGVHSSRWSIMLGIKIPIHVSVLTNSDFEDYDGGVAKSCAGRREAHGMLLVGEGRENGVDFWLMRNSYGDWAADGHYKLSKKATECLSDQQMGYVPSAFLATSGASFVESASK